MPLRFLHVQTRASSDLLTGLTRRWFSAKSTVMSFGDGSHGALGISASTMGIGMDAYEPTPIPGLPPDVSSIAAGHYHSIAVTSAGNVWAWGRNSEAQLGRGEISPRETWNEPRMVEGLNEVKVRSAFASGVISSAIGDDGSLWVWGKSKRGQLGLGKDVIEAVLPARVKALSGQEIVKVSLGWGHALALTKDHKLFGWGYYADGRLGKVGKDFEDSPLDSIARKVKSSNKDSDSTIEAAEKLVLEAIEKEKDMPVIWEPTLIEELRDVDVVDVACGLDHSLILCGDGTLLSGGSNVYGQLGRSNQDLGLQPVDIPLRPITIASGLGHCFAICKDSNSSKNDSDSLSSLVTWGWNQNSQLGRVGPANRPLLVDSFSSEVPISVCGGRVHSLALTANKEVWSWGCGRNGRLGLSSSGDESEPVMVESLEGFQVEQVVAGFDHNLVLVIE